MATMPIRGRKTNSVIRTLTLRRMAIDPKANNGASNFGHPAKLSSIWSVSSRKLMTSLAIRFYQPPSHPSKAALQDD